MVKVSIEVRNGAARFKVAIRAESIRWALSLQGRRYPDGDVGVRVPIDPEGFLVEDPATRAGLIEPPKRMAA